jgi:dinuclear metal center YbgI/SA1388 family protein
LKVKDIIETMDKWAPPDIAYSWDKSGLATGCPNDSVSKVLTALTITSETIKTALKYKAEMIVSHHPLIWEPITTLRTDNPISSLVLTAAENNIACYSAHTNLDIVPGGVNHVLANRLGLTKVLPLFPSEAAKQLKLVTFLPEDHLTIVRSALADAGAGRIGNYTNCGFTVSGTGSFLPNDHANPYAGTSEELNEVHECRLEMILPNHKSREVVEALINSHPYEEVAYDLIPLQNRDSAISLGLQGELKKPLTLDTFAKKTKEALEISHVRVTGESKAKVKNISVMGGAGGSMAQNIPSHIDVFVTGDVKYHETLDAQAAGLNVIDAGHHGTEKWIAHEIAAHLKEKHRGIKFKVFKESDPFRVI